VAAKIFFVLFIGLLLFTRLYNLDRTTRFIWDESSDLVRLHQIYVNHKLTLIGPISEDNSKVFGSLAYYLSLPFAAFYHFDPLSPVLGTVVGGLITAVALVVAIKHVNARRSVTFWLTIGLILLGWFPLLQSSRASLWAWHVSYIPMWQVLGLLFYLRGTKISRLLAGFCLGLTIHHHYLAIFASIAFCLAASITLIKQKNWRDIGWLFAGFTLALMPFVIFDLRHPPGLFLTKLLYAKPIETQLSMLSALSKLIYLFRSLLGFFTQNQIGALFLGIGVMALLLWDAIKLRPALLWGAGWVGQLLGLIYISNDGVSIHYTLPAAVFFLVWLIIPRPRMGNYLAQGCLLILAITSLASLKSQLITKSWRTDIPLARAATTAIKNDIAAAQLQNVNLAVLASADNNVYGRRYRDVLLVEETRLRTKDEYQYSDHLFVITTSPEATIRSDPAYEMHFFRQGKLVQTWNFDAGWHMYLFNKNPH